MARALGKWIVSGAVLWLTIGTGMAQDDPPGRVLRLSFLTGNVGMQPAGVNDWAPAVINRPFSIADYLYTDQSAIAELRTDVAVMRMGQYTNMGVLNVTDNLVQVKLTQGDVFIRVHDLDPDDALEVDTPNAAISLLRNGVYRLHVDPNANTTFVVARSGQAEVSGGGQAFTLNPGNSAELAGTDELAYAVANAPAPDAFDNWCTQRDASFAGRNSARYVAPTVIGYEDLDGNGNWGTEPDYGPVWYPTSVAVDWAPYHYGHWAWIEPWGWTWIDDAPWGFAPFHYGRWVYVRSRWGWCPGPIAVVQARPVRPVYAPALVAWFGGSHWGVSVAIGGAPSVGWVPLGFGEVYTPAYHVSPRYFTNVNVNNTRIVNNVNITNVYKTVYVNKTVYQQTFVNVQAPHAVVAMPQSGFASGRPVNQVAVALRPEQTAELRARPAVVMAPGVAPTRQSLVATMGRPAARPPQQIADRVVFAKRQPPAAPVAFAARQAALQQHAGEPYDARAAMAAVHQVPQTAQVRQVPAARPVAVQPGQHVGVVPAGASAAQFNARPANTRDFHNGNTNVAPPVQQHGVPPAKPVQQPTVTPQRGVPAAKPVQQPAVTPQPHVQEPQRVNRPAVLPEGERSTPPTHGSEPRQQEHVERPARVEQAPTQHVNEQPRPEAAHPQPAPPHAQPPQPRAEPAKEHEHPKDTKEHKKEPPQR